MFRDFDIVTKSVDFRDYVLIFYVHASMGQISAFVAKWIFIYLFTTKVRVTSHKSELCSH